MLPVEEPDISGKNEDRILIILMFRNKIVTAALLVTKLIVDVGHDPDQHQLFWVRFCAFISSAICQAMTRLRAITVASSRRASSLRKSSKLLPILFCSVFKYTK